VQDIVDSFLISVAKRYDVKGKTYFNYPNKYYYTYIGLRNARLELPGSMIPVISWKTWSTTSFCGAATRSNVGVVTRPNKGCQYAKRRSTLLSMMLDRKIYIQSAFRMDTEQKTASELDSLLLTKDFFKKIVVRMDIPHNFYDESGIFHCNLIDLLLGRVELL